MISENYFCARVWKYYSFIWCICVCCVLKILLWMLWHTWHEYLYMYMRWIKGYHGCVLWWQVLNVSTYEVTAKSFQTFHWLILSLHLSWSCDERMKEYTWRWKRLASKNFIKADLPHFIPHKASVSLITQVSQLKVFLI